MLKETAPFENSPGGNHSLRGCRCLPNSDHDSSSYYRQACPQQTLGTVLKRQLRIMQITGKLTQARLQAALQQHDKVKLGRRRTQLKQHMPKDPTRDQKSFRKCCPGTRTLDLNAAQFLARKLHRGAT